VAPRGHGRRARLPVIGLGVPGIVRGSPVNGDTRNPFEVESVRRWSHVRPSMYPDGGIARFRVHGEGLLDPRFADGLPLDLAALENGGRISAWSNVSRSLTNLLLPGTARTIGERPGDATRRGK
jgi:allantoicase